MQTNVDVIENKQYAIFNFLFVIGKYGVWFIDNVLQVNLPSFNKPNPSYKEHIKALKEKVYLNAEFLSKFGFNIEIYPIGAKKFKYITVSHSVNPELIPALKLLAERDDYGSWQKYFSACLFNTSNLRFYIERLNTLLGFDEGYIASFLERYKERGYEIKYDVLGCSANKNGAGSGFDFNHKQSLNFSSSALGIKAMLEDFDSLDKSTQQLLVERCNNCSDCMFCAKGKGGEITKKQYAQNVAFDGQSYKLCPSYPNLCWSNHEITKEVTERIFAFNISQENYAKEWRKKS